MSGAAERIVGALVGAARVGLLAWGLTTRDYGIYVAVLGIVATTGLIDLACDSGLVNAVSDACGREDDRAIRGAVSSAFVVYLCIAIAALLVFLPLTLLLPMQSLLRIPAGSVSTARQIAAIGFGEALLVMPLRVFPVTFVLDPFTAVPTLSLVCNIAHPGTVKRYSRDPRYVAQKAEEYLRSSGIADTCYFGPEAEFYVLDNVRYKSSDNIQYVEEIWMRQAGTPGAMVAPQTWAIVCASKRAISPSLQTIPCKICALKWRSC